MRGVEGGRTTTSQFEGHWDSDPGFICDLVRGRIFKCFCVRLWYYEKGYVSGPRGEAVWLGLRDLGRLAGAWSRGRGREGGR